MSSLTVKLPTEVSIDASLTVAELNKLASRLGCELRYRDGLAFVPRRELYRDRARLVDMQG